LTEDNFEKKFSRATNYNLYPLSLHVSITRYSFAPYKADGIYGIDYIIDIDGGDESAKILGGVISILSKRELEHYTVTKTCGAHNGYQIRIEQEAFADTRVFTPQIWNETRLLYTYSTFLLSALLKTDKIELKLGDVMHRAPWGVNEVTHKKVELIKNESPDLMEGEDYKNWVFEMMKLKYYKDLFAQMGWRRPHLIGVKRKVGKQYSSSARYNLIDRNKFPPCILIGMETMVKPGNREKAVFAMWRYLSNKDYTKDAIARYMIAWYNRLKDRGIFDNEIYYKIKEKLNRPLKQNYPLTCLYAQKIGVCPYICGRKKP